MLKAMALCASTEGQEPTADRTSAMGPWSTEVTWGGERRCDQRMEPHGYVSLALNGIVSTIQFMISVLIAWAW